MIFSDAKADYLNSIKHETKLTASTCKSYQCMLNSYERFLKSDYGYDNPTLAEALDVSMLRKYQYHLDAKGLRPRSIHGRFDPIQSLCAYLLENGALTENPTSKLRMPRRDTAKRERISDIEAEALLECADRQVKSASAAQSKAILAVFFFTGIRADESANICVNDIRLDMEPPFLDIPRGKGLKARRVALSTECVVILKQWLAERAKMGCTHDRLWSSTPQRYVSQEWLRSDIENVKAIAGYKGKANIKPHSMRHWFATNLMRNGATIKQIQYALGHSSPKTTMVYLGIDEEDEAAIAELSVLRRKGNDGAAGETPQTLRSAPTHSSTKAARNKTRSAFMQRRRQTAV